jgi:hypothetical protein
MSLTPYVSASWAQLLDASNGYLEAIRRELSPAISPSERWHFELVSIAFDRPRYSETECERFGLSLAAPIKPTLRQIVYDDRDPPSIQDIREQEIYSGESLLPTRAGCVLVDGAPRVVRAELGPCLGLAPFERGWRAGNIWGDAVEFVREKGGVAITVRLADDSLPSSWAREPVSFDAPPKARVPFIEPALPPTVTVKSRADIEAFFALAQIDAPNIAVGAPQSLFERPPGERWSFDDLLRVIDWVQSDEAERARREAATPLRALGPGLVLARWLRRGLFLTMHTAIERGETMSFGPRLKPKKRAAFDWYPHDTWNAKPLAQLVRARAESEAWTPRCPSAHPVAIAELLRTLRVPAHVTPPKGWQVDASKKLTLAQLPLCDILEDGTILRPDRWTARTLPDALAFGGSLPSTRPLLISGAEPAPIESALAPTVARLGAMDCFDRDCMVLAATDEAIAVSDTDRGAFEWIEPRRPRADDRCLLRDTLTATVGAHAKGQPITRSLAARDATLALGRTLRIGFDRRVAEGSLWLSTDRIGAALDALRAGEIECVVRDTRLGREEWSDAATTDSLATVGDRVATGGTLATVLVPTDDEGLSPEERLLAAINGTSAGPVRERRTRWTGPDATVIDRAIFARRGVEELVPLAVDRARRVAQLRERERACEALPEDSRASLLDLVQEDLYRAERGNDLPPGVIALARWLLSWSEPIAQGSTLATRTGHRFVIESVTAERFFEGAAQVDALVHPATRDRILVEARATFLAMQRNETVSVAPDTTLERALEALVTPSSDPDAFALYVLRLT